MPEASKGLLLHTRFRLSVLGPSQPQMEASIRAVQTAIILGREKEVLAGFPPITMYDCRQVTVCLVPIFFFYKASGDNAQYSVFLPGL